MDVKIYTTPTCGYCHQAKSFLSESGVRFSEYDVSCDQAASEEMVRLTGQMGVPVILVDGQVVIGFDRPRLENLLAGAGSVRRPRFGLRVADADRVAQKFGAVVGVVASSSLGEKAGLRVGDIITEVNQKRINDAAELEQTLAGLSAGSRVTLVFRRGQETLKSAIVL
ncbi:Uxx-star family glutaredoxin-like (seleno)protein [Chloroflexota bacterium]